MTDYHVKLVKQTGKITLCEIANADYHSKYF